MSAVKDGGPAFPLGSVELVDGVHYAEAGMSLLDYFAAKALPSIINLCRHDKLDDNKSLVDHFAGNAYAVAHAMLAAREVTK